MLGTSTYDAAISLAKAQFHVFPLAEGTKDTPIIKAFPKRATTDVSKIERWWVDPVLGFTRPYNVAISTTSYNGTEALLVVDVDIKKKGHDHLLELELQGFYFPTTYTQTTPTGGLHLVYRTKTPVKQGVSVLGPGLDIRSKGGYIVGRGSVINGVSYTANDLAIAPAPEWLIEKCGEPKKKTTVQVLGTLDEERATKRVIHYLENEAPLAIEGAGGDEKTYQVAAAVKDFGVDELAAHLLMLEFWNDRCSPPWGPEELGAKVEHAYRYGNEPVGAKAPEVQFDPIVEDKKGHPFDEINKDWAFVLAGSAHHIIWETKDDKGRFVLRHIKEESFHAKLKPLTLMIGNKEQQLSKLWMGWKGRRSYDGFCFRPGLPTPEKYCNLWRGFSVEPLEKDREPSALAQKALDDWLSHIRINVCHGDEKLMTWFVGFFAHLVQKPWEKPIVSLVMKGRKGVGKNAVLDRIGHILGPHYLETARREDLTGRFNGQYENKLLFVLSEAFWSGDKAADGVLKHLITGSDHNIEHKGQEKFRVDNLARIVIVGNDDWLVPVSPDDRRYAVFNVGTGRQQDNEFFMSIKRGMEDHGGYELLLRYLQTFDISGIDINRAPLTQGLADQKHASLDPFHQWWFDCLKEGTLIGSDAGDDWPEMVEKVRLRDAFRRYIKDHQINSRIPSDILLGRQFKKCFRSVDMTAKKRIDNTTTVNAYRFGTIEAAREDWNKFIRHSVEWEKEGDEDDSVKA